MVGAAETRRQSAAAGAAAPGAELERQLAALESGDHLCLIYESPSEALVAAAAYMRDGLQRGERCVYIVDERTAAEVRAALADLGLAVDHEIGRGALQLATKRETYLRSGEFDPGRMLEFLADAVESALADGFSGLRVTGEMTWALGPETAVDRLIEYEARLNRFFPGSRASAICQYNRQRFAPDVIRDVLRTHPIAVVGDQVCPNPFYESPALVLDGGSAAERVDWMIDQMREARASAQRLEQALRLRDEFLSVAAHELRTPLTSLRGLADLAVRRLDRDQAPGPYVRDTLRRVSIQVDRVGRLLNLLLDTSRIDAGAMQLERAEVDLAQLASHAIVLASIQSPGHVFLLDAPTRAVAALDPLRVEQVLTNLLDNAMKFSASGTQVDVVIRQSRLSLSLAVRDRGNGVPPDRRSQLFDRYFQGHADNHNSGMGLGLYVSRQIVEAHGGTIRAEFPPDGGTRFVAEFPRHTGR